MYLRYRNYSHAVADAAVGITRHPLRTDGDMPWGYKEVWRITGVLIGSDENDINAQCVALKNAYAYDGGDIGLFFDNGQVTNHVLFSHAARGGTRILEHPSFPIGDGTEGATARTYSIVVEADIENPFVLLQSWNETLSFEGGGPMFGHLQTLNGLPQKQLLAQATPYMVVQEGEAVGQYTWPTPPGPIWPGALKHGPGFRKHNPRRYGPIGNPQYREFPISWRWVFESNTPLDGNPTPWIA